MSRATSRKMIVVCVVLDAAAAAAAGAPAVVRTGGIEEEAGFVGRGGTGALVFGVVLVVVAAVEAGVVMDCCCCINGTTAAAAATEEDSEAEEEGIAAPERVPTAQRRRGFVVFSSASASRVRTATVFVPPLGCSSPSKATSSKTVLYWMAATQTAGPAWSGPGANAWTFPNWARIETGTYPAFKSRKVARYVSRDKFVTEK